MGIVDLRNFSFTMTTSTTATTTAGATTRRTSSRNSQGNLIIRQAFNDFLCSFGNHILRKIEMTVFLISFLGAEVQGDMQGTHYTPLYMLLHLAILV